MVIQLTCLKNLTCSVRIFLCQCIRLAKYVRYLTNCKCTYKSELYFNLSALRKSKINYFKFQPYNHNMNVDN